jgi:hypothetical protein
VAGGRFDPWALAWMGEHLPEFRQQASGQRPLYWILGIGFVVGLAAHVGGFLFKTSATTEPLLLVADLLYSLGFALWTGVVLVFFVQIWPRPNGASSSGRSMPTRRCCARRPEPEAARRRGTTECRRRGSGQAERPAGWCDMSWSMTPTAFSSPLENRVGGDIGATNSRIAPDNSGYQRSASCQLTSHIRLDSAGHLLGLPAWWAHVLARPGRYGSSSRGRRLLPRTPSHSAGAAATGTRRIADDGSHRSRSLKTGVKKIKIHALTS